MKKMTKAMLMTALICGTMYCGAEPVYANELDTFTLDEYVVTATRTPVELFNANANISVVTKEQIENRHYQNVQEVLEDVPGVLINNYGLPGHATGHGLRINGSSKVLLMIDGIRMNQGAESNLYELLSDMDNIERVEVLHGAASSLYGADAQGGVINIITTKKPNNQTKAFIEGGSFDKLRMGLSTQGSENGWSYRIAGTKSKIGDAEDGRGEDIIQSDDAKTLNVMVGKQLGDKGDITVFYDKYKSDYEYMKSYHYDWTNSGPVLTPYNGKIMCGGYETESYRMIFNYNFDDTLSNRLTVSRNERIMNLPDVDGGLMNIVSVGVTDQITKQFGDNNTLTGGIDYQTDKFVTGFDSEANGNSTGTDMNGTKLKDTAFYIQDIHRLNDKLNFTVGARYDDNNLYDGEFTGNGKIGYEFNDDTNMYVSYGTFFNSPTVFQLYNGVHGNKDLKAENGKNFEIGFNHRFDDSFEVSAHFFKRETEDAIAYDYTNQKYYNNEDTEDARGIDIQLNKKFSDKWNANVAYTYTKVESKSIYNGSTYLNENASGYIPKHVVNVGVNYSLDKFNTDLVARGVFDRPGANVNHFPEKNYWVVDLGLNYKADKNHKFYLKVNNLFDKFYVERSNTGWGVSDINVIEWWGMPGRSFLVGMEYSF